MQPEAEDHEDDIKDLEEANHIQEVNTKTNTKIEIKIEIKTKTEIRPITGAPATTITPPKRRATTIGNGAETPGGVVIRKLAPGVTRCRHHKTKTTDNLTCLITV